jgi:hypothetical protein
MASIPFVTTKFGKEYIVPYYIGETLIAVIPSSLALLQGTGEDKGCQNVTKFTSNFINESFTEHVNETTLESIPLSPRFSVSTYFAIILCFLLVSFLSFIFLNFLKFSKTVKEKEEEEEAARNGMSASDTLLEKPVDLEKISDADAIKNNVQKRKDMLEKRFLLFLNFMVTFVMYGILPAMNSYSTLPYGF